MIKTALIALSLSVFAQNTQSYDFFNSKWKISKNAHNALLIDKVLVESDVKNDAKSQTFKMKAMAYHPKKCSKVLKKLAMFENYPNMIDFIKKANYSEKYELLTVHADHTLLPFPMIVHIKMKRPDKEGVYEFVFPTGLFQGLKGTFEVKEVDKKCSVFAKSYWSGKNTKIPNFAIELFSETLTKLAVQTLIRKTSF